MVLIQSRYQNIFNRFYLGSINYFWALLPLIILPLFFDKHSNNLGIELYVISFIVPLVAITLWLVVFNSGQSKIIEYGLEANENGISFIKYGSKQTINWSDFAGFVIINRLPRLIILKGANDQNIEFSYYTFSSEQRKELFQVLSTK
ncbi:hypothetical protein [Thalassotalea profundi]|uniref:YcxB family protein n=1 Tax=Thalassotalea profundi TaxID=2036687 RepID=A0ABQ3IGE3_9GAMM|nr:hypothetical protein [Thalassotalea profundi]GHE83562.1 hypothetical protein GCM10011501_10150 [Thalassotalea profundi]